MDPYLRACQEFEKARIPYLIVGAFGANLYARAVGTVVTTPDWDLLVTADPSLLGRAVRVLRKLRYRMGAEGEPVDSDPDLLRGIVRA